MNRNQQNTNRPGTAFRQPTDAANEAKPSGAGHQPNPSSPDTSSWSKWKVWVTGLLVVAIAVLLAAVLWLMIFARPVSEANYVDNNRMQAVFLSNEQVYFGNVQRVDSQFLVLTNIYYLQSPEKVSNKSTTGNVSLVKLGCELHRPQDMMVINQEQVTFWENLDSDGQVAKAVDQFEQANPNGQKCEAQTTNTTSQQESQAQTSTQQESKTTDTTKTNDQTKSNQ